MVDAEVPDDDERVPTERSEDAPLVADGPGQEAGKPDVDPGQESEAPSKDSPPTEATPPRGIRLRATPSRGSTSPVAKRMMEHDKWTRGLIRSAEWDLRRALGQSASLRGVMGVFSDASRWLREAQATQKMFQPYESIVRSAMVVLPSTRPGPELVESRASEIVRIAHEGKALARLFGEAGLDLDRYCSMVPRLFASNASGKMEQAAHVRYESMIRDVTPALLSAAREMKGLALPAGLDMTAALRQHDRMLAALHSRPLHSWPPSPGWTSPETSRIAPIEDSGPDAPPAKFQPEDGQASPAPRGAAGSSDGARPPVDADLAARVPEVVWAFLRRMAAEFSWSEEKLVAAIFSVLTAGGEARRSGDEASVARGQSAERNTPTCVYYAIAYSSNGERSCLSKADYGSLVADRRRYDFIIDGIARRCFKRKRPDAAHTEAKLTAGEFRLIREYIVQGGIHRPVDLLPERRTDWAESAIRYFNAARRKVDIPVGRRDFTLFRTHGGSAAKERCFEFAPADEIVWVLIEPASA